MAGRNMRAFATFVVLYFIGFTGTKALITPEDNKIQEGDEIKGKEADMIDWLKHPCRRECKDDEPPKLCYYQFLVENSMTMSKACYDCPYNKKDCFRQHCMPGDGNQRNVIVVNRQLPGPAVEVCHGDIIKVNVRNLMRSESLTIHWHGINQQATPYMDGVPFVTQCPVCMNEIFTYQFNATESGTHFWHSHVGGQRGDGFFGTLVVRQKPRDNPHKNLYDYDEHSMIIIDWKEKHLETEFITLVTHAKPLQAPDTILINGLGRNKEFKNENNETFYTPDAIFKVKQGSKYRFRFVNAGAENCPLEMSIDNHTMTVISTDSHDIEPVEVDVIHSWPGERYDFIVNADQKIDNYWIRYRGNGKLCNNMVTKKRLHQVAILRYEGADIADPKSPIDPNLPDNTNARELNPFEKGTESPEAISIPYLKTLEPEDPSISRKPDLQIFLNLDFYRIDNYDFHRRGVVGYNEAPNATRTGTFQFNYITFNFPRFPLLSQRKDIFPSMTCDESILLQRNCRDEQCSCTHVISIPLNSVVELIVIDEGAFDQTNHPMHLHGQPFRVIGTEKLIAPISRQEFQRMDKNGLIPRQLNSTVLKDTMKVPSGGYTIVRFYANNPGFWFYHCHFEQHIELGLALVFQVGEYNDMLPVPKNFPTCGKIYP